MQVSAANGAEEYYQVENNTARKEGIELARVLDRRASEVVFVTLVWDGCGTVVPLRSLVFKRH